MQTIGSEVNCQSLLTIAIPTYNRSAFLELSLKRINDELAKMSNDRRKLVKVYVSNNASTDNTIEIISRNQCISAGEFEAVHNAENMGGERNVVQCYAVATTPYVWVLGDDDVILPGKLQLVLDVLAKQEIDILYMHGYSYSDNYLDEPKRGRGKSGFRECSSALDFVRHTHVILTSITALVVRSGVKAKTAKHVVEGSNLPQLGWIFPLLCDGKKFAIIEDRIFAAKMGNSGGYDAINVFGSNLTKIANSILKDQPELANAIQNGTIVIWFPNYIMDVRKGDSGYLKEDIAIEMKRVFGGNWRYFFFLAPLMSLPMKLAQCYFIFVRLIRLLLRRVLI